MAVNPQTQGVDQDRRRLLATATMGIVATGAVGVLAPNAASAVTPGADEAIRPFRIGVPEADVVDLRRRLAAVRWPDKETVADDSQGVPLAMMQEVVGHW